MNREKRRRERIDYAELLDGARRGGKRGAAVERGEGVYDAWGGRKAAHPAAALSLICALAPVPLPTLS